MQKTLGKFCEAYGQQTMDNAIASQRQLIKYFVPYQIPGLKCL